MHYASLPTSMRQLRADVWRCWAIQRRTEAPWRHRAVDTFIDLSVMSHELNVLKVSVLMKRYRLMQLVWQFWSQTGEDRQLSGQ